MTRTESQNHHTIYLELKSDWKNVPFAVQTNSKGVPYATFYAHNFLISPRNYFIRNNNIIICVEGSK
jgi:hypothetical protein